MVKLVRVERACEQTGNQNCPLHASQIERTSRLQEATRVKVVTLAATVAWHAGMSPLDPTYKPKASRYLALNKTWKKG